MMPGRYPRRVSRILIQKARPTPAVRNTPNGGSKMASRIRRRSIVQRQYSIFFELQRMRNEVWSLKPEV